MISSQSPQLGSRLLENLHARATSAQGAWREARAIRVWWEGAAGSRRSGEALWHEEVWRRLDALRVRPGCAAEGRVEGALQTLERH